MNEEQRVMCFSSTRYVYLFTHLNLQEQTISHFDYSLFAVYSKIKLILIVFSRPIYVTNSIIMS